MVMMLRNNHIDNLYYSFWSDDFFYSPYNNRIMNLASSLQLKRFMTTYQFLYPRDFYFDSDKQHIFLGNIIRKNIQQFTYIPMSFTLLGLWKLFSHNHDMEPSPLSNMTYCDLRDQLQMAYLYYKNDDEK